jgi:hypothetical protein
MEGAAQMLTLEMDVYAFAICCWEILKMGALPYTPMDDDTVRHLVLCRYPFACVFLVEIITPLSLKP